MSFFFWVKKKNFFSFFFFQKKMKKNFFFFESKKKNFFSFFFTQKKMKIFSFFLIQKKSLHLLFTFSQIFLASRNRRSPFFRSWKFWVEKIFSFAFHFLWDLRSEIFSFAFHFLEDFLFYLFIDLACLKFASKVKIEKIRFLRFKFNLFSQPKHQFLLKVHFWRNSLKIR